MASTTKFEPKNRVVRWFDSRLPILSLMHGTMVAYPVPRNFNWWYTFGSLAGLMLVIQMATGIVLTMHYTPNADLAFGSVEAIMRDVNYGWLLRYIHANGASMFFLVVYIHIFRGLYYGSYKEPREMVWIIGLIIYLLMMATGFMGYVLPWGQMSFWGATVITNFFSAIPVVGDSIVTWLWGGFSVDNPTLQRFFALHYLLPFVIAAFVGMHIWALHIQGSNNPLGIEPKGPQDTVPFHPYYTAKDAVGVALFIIFFSIFIFYLPNALGHPDNYIPADPLVTPPHIVPEWYYLPFYAILKAMTADFLGVPAKLWGVIAMFGSILILFFMPWLDRSKVRSARFRPVYKQVFWLLFAVVLGLGWCGAHTPDEIMIDLGPNTDRIAEQVESRIDTRVLREQFAAIDHDDLDAVKAFAARVGVTPKAFDEMVETPGNRSAFTVGVFSQILTFYYFFHFLVLVPLLGFLEKPLPLPTSISEAVLKKKSA
jgi:quinol-cytochrome oxidoreductase complex cytochrome b subunit